MAHVNQTTYLMDVEKKSSTSDPEEGEIDDGDDTLMNADQSEANVKAQDGYQPDPIIDDQKALDGDKVRVRLSDHMLNKKHDTCKGRNRKRGHMGDHDETDKETEQMRMLDSAWDEEPLNENEMIFVRGSSPVTKRYKQQQGLTFGPTSESANEDGSDHSCSDANSMYSSTLKAFRLDRRNRAKRSRKRGMRRKKTEERKVTEVCKFHMKGKCHKGSSCSYSHLAMPCRIMEVCKFYLMDRCAKQDKCLYMHGEFPCKFFHTGLKCFSGAKCKFSHRNLTGATKEVLLKHLVTAPMRMLQDFPRLSREGALAMMDGEGSRIPSLLDIKVPIPAKLRAVHDVGKVLQARQTAPNLSGNGNGDASAGQRLPFYREIFSRLEGKPCDQQALGIMDMNTVGGVNVRSAGHSPNSTESMAADSIDKKSLQENETPLNVKETEEECSRTGDTDTTKLDDDEIPLHLPKKQRELYQRIKQQQREVHVSMDLRGADDSRDEGWYSSDEEETTLADVLKNISQQGQKSSPLVESASSNTSPVDDLFNTLLASARLEERPTVDKGMRQPHGTNATNISSSDSSAQPQASTSIYSNKLGTSAHCVALSAVRWMLPFKPAPLHAPATEIDASLMSHKPMLYKVTLVDVPTPDYSNFKVNSTYQQMCKDPRLRKILKLGQPPVTSPQKESTLLLTAQHLALTRPPHLIPTVDFLARTHHLTPWERCGQQTKGGDRRSP